jgi:hypothetical protein
MQLTVLHIEDSATTIPLLLSRTFFRVIISYIPATLQKGVEEGRVNVVGSTKHRNSYADPEELGKGNV